MLAEEAADKSLQGFHAIGAIHVLDLPGLRLPERETGHTRPDLSGSDIRT